MIPIADEVADIRRRLDEIEAERRAAMARTALLEPDDEVVCLLCEGGGWEAYGLGRNDPHFRVCTACGNPEGRPSP
jgi:hypothetical protein